MTAPSSRESAPPERLAGSVERVTFHSEESGFCVLRVQVRGQRDLVTVVGNADAYPRQPWPLLVSELEYRR